MWEWNEPAVRNLLNTLSVEKSRVMLMAKDGLPEGNWLKEKWYGAEYWTEKLPTNVVEQVRSASDSHELLKPIIEIRLRTWKIFMTCTSLNLTSLYRRTLM